MNCPAPQWIHDRDLCGCKARAIREAMGETEDAASDEGDDYAADRVADSPLRGQSAGLNAMRRIP